MTSLFIQSINQSISHLVRYFFLKKNSLKHMVCCMIFTCMVFYVYCTKYDYVTVMNVEMKNA